MSKVNIPNVLALTMTLTTSAINQNKDKAIWCVKKNAKTVKKKPREKGLEKTKHILTNKPTSLCKFHIIIDLSSN